MPSAAPAKPAFDLKSTAWTLTALRLQVAELPSLLGDLDARFADSPGLFDNEPVVIDLGPLQAADAALDWPTLLAHLRGLGMLPIAAQGGSPAQMAAALAAGLAQAPDAQAPTAVRRAEAPVQAPEPGPAPAKVVDKPLRSGQRVYARGGDLVVLAMVSHGAEVIADGSIHVYGPLRGRAIAGARGDTRARVYSTCMEPQLVSIAGIYRTTETPLAAEVLARPAQVRLDGERILFEPLAS